MKTLGSTMRRVRLERGLSFHAASERMDSVSDQSIKNLECGVTAGSEVKLRTALEIVKAYWPDVELADFMPRAPFRIVPRDSRSAHRLKYG